MIAKIQELLEEVEKLKASNLEEVEALRIKYLSKKEVIDVNPNDHFHAWLHSLGENPMQEAWTSHTLLSSEFL